MKHIEHDLGRGGAKDDVLRNLSINEKYVVITSDKDFLPRKINKNTAVIFIFGGRKMKNIEIQFSINRGMNVFKSFSDYQGKIVVVYKNDCEIRSCNGSVKRVKK